MKNYSIAILALASVVMLAACSNNSNEPRPGETVHHDEHSEVNTVMLSPEQMKSIQVELGAIEKKQLTASLRANGILKVPNQNRASATAIMGGVIQSIRVQPGNRISKGQIIATIVSTSFISMQEEFLNVSNQVGLAELEYNRQKELYEGNATSLKVLQQAESELKQYKTRKASLQKQLELAGLQTARLSSENIQPYMNITSPVTGSVSSVLVNLGSFVDANNPIAEIIDNSQLHLDLFVYEKDLSKIKVGQTIHFTLTNNPGKEYDADVFSISNTFEENTRAVAVHAVVKGNKEGLIDGMAIIALASLESAVLDAVPTKAIVSHEGRDYIFIVKETPEKPDEHQQTVQDAHHDTGHSHDKPQVGPNVVFERIPVRRGTTDVGYTEIYLLKEIPKRSKVVINGAFFILAHMNNTGQAHSH